jgi:hypothetical protein
VAQVALAGPHMLTQVWCGCLLLQMLGLEKDASQVRTAALKNGVYAFQLDLSIISTLTYAWPGGLAAILCRAMLCACRQI